MKITSFPLALLMIIGLLLATSSATVSAQDDDNPRSTEDSGNGGSSTDSGSSSTDSGSSGSDDPASTTSDDDSSPFTSESRGSAAETRLGPVQAPIGRFALGLRTWDLSGANSVGPFAGAATFRYWVEEGFNFEGSLGFGIRDNAGNTEVSFLLGIGSLITLVEKSPVWVHFGQRANFGFVSDAGGGTTDASELMFEFPLIVEYFISADFSLFLSVGVSVHIITGDAPVFGGSIVSNEGFSIIIGRGNLLGSAGFVFWF